MRSLAVARATIVGATILVPLLLLELAIRVAGPFLPGNYDTGSYLERHPRYGHYHPVSYDGWTRRDEFVVRVRTNAEGQRGPAVPIERAPDTFRILVLGDSFVEAIQVAEHERFLARLERELNPPGAAIRVELIDGGTLLDAEHPSAMLRGIARRASMPVLDLLPRFRKAAAGRGTPPLYFVRDQHWTAAGHALATEGIVELLRAGRLLPE